MLKNIKLYRINQENYKFDKIKEREKKIEKVIQEGYKKYKKKGKVDIKDIPILEKEGIKYYLFVYNFGEKKSEWINFFPNQLTSDLKFDIINISVLLFIDNGIDIFVIVGGNGYQLIIPFIDHSFGLMVYSKIMNPEEDIIVSINSRGLTGARSGISEQYRNEFKIIDFVRFGKVPKEIHIIISKLISNEYFNFLQKKRNEKIKIYAGKSFNVKKNLNFEELHRLINEIGFILERPESDFLSSYIEVRNSRQINEELEPLLIREIFNDLQYYRKSIIETGDKRFKFDFCNPDKMVQFYEADNYVLKEKVGERDYNIFKEVENREDIYDEVLSRAVELHGDNDFYRFRSYIRGVRILAYTGNTKPASSGFIYHFTSEFIFDKQPIFLVDTKWYRLKKTFVEDLKHETVQIVRNNKLPAHILNLPWDKNKLKKEAEYNLQYDGLENYLVLDTFTPDGIELCDVMYIEKDKIYLIHVKYGFSAPIRELVNQITLSARRLYEDSKSAEKPYLTKIFEFLKAKKNYPLNLSLKEFKELFERKIVYVFAFTSGLANDDNIEENIEKYKSNIAKYSLIQCRQDMQTSVFDLNICQIKRK